MISSMTGQGRATSLIKPEGLKLSVEVYSVNHRYLDISLKLPDQLASNEDKIRAIIKQHLSRGAVNLGIHLEQPNGKNLVLDTAVLDDFLKLIKELGKKVKISQELPPDILLRIPGLIREQPRDVNEEKLRTEAEKLVARALRDLARMRRAEGKNLEADLRKRLEVIARNLSAVKKLVPKRNKKKRAKLTELLEELKIEPDQGRLMQEVLYFSERFDIHEECVRLENHIKLFRQTLGAKQSNGRRLNFTAQEMMKETNTIGAKANDTEISHYVIAIKEEVEKIREQIQNVE